MRDIKDWKAWSIAVVYDSTKIHQEKKEKIKEVDIRRGAKKLDPSNSSVDVS